MRTEGGGEYANDRNILGTVVIDVLLSFNFAAIDFLFVIFMLHATPHLYCNSAVRTLIKIKRKLRFKILSPSAAVIILDNPIQTYDFQANLF